MAWKKTDFSECKFQIDADNSKCILHIFKVEKVEQSFTGMFHVDCASVILPLQIVRLSTNLVYWYTFMF